MVRHVSVHPSEIQSEIVDLNTSRYDLAGGGTNTAGIAFGGRDPNPTVATEEFTGAGVSPDTITATSIETS